MNTEMNFDNLVKHWPSPMVARQAVAQFTGGLMSPKLLANLDAQKKGPPGRFYIGRRAAYPVDSFVKWLKDRCKSHSS